MTPLHRCVCVSHRCGDVTDPRTGDVGVLVPIRILRIHEKDDNAIRRSELEQLARTAQAAALEAHDATIARSLLATDPPTAPAIPPTRPPRYRHDFVRQTVSDLSQWKERLTHLGKEVESVGLPAQRPTVAAIRTSLERCKSMQISCDDIAHNIRLVRQGSYRNQASVQSLLEEMDVDLSQAKCQLTSTLASWKAALKKADAEASRENIYDTSSNFDTPFENSPPILQVVSLLVVTCHIVLGLPRRGCLWLFSMCAYMVEITMQQAILLLKTRGAISTVNHFATIFKNFPKGLRSASNNFRLDGKSVVYAVCCKCHETYKPKEENGVPVYPARCNAKRYGYRCGEILVRPKIISNRTIYVPIKPYVVFDFREWLSRLMSREGMEEQMDGAWARMGHMGTMDDIFQGSVIRELKGPNGTTHFSTAGPNEETGRYLFSMGCDFFNPLRNLANGKRVSVGIIAIVCLNLHISVRYKPENMFLGAIIPGPREPSLDAINPYLRPFVDMFLQLWEGVKFTRTSLYEHGRWVYCALIAIICDLPASRKVGGFSSCNHEYFCAVCWCNKTEHTYEDLNYQSWTWRTNQTCRDWAERYRCATTAKSASSVFDRSGCRWTELLRLPYFDPTQHLVVDPMHNLFLGLVKEHFQHILGYYPQGVKPDKKVLTRGYPADISIDIQPSTWNPLPNSPGARKGVRKLRRRLSELHGIADGTNPGSRTALAQYYMGSGIQLQSLVFVTKALLLVPRTIQMDGRDSNLPFSPALRKADLAVILVQWRVLQRSCPSRSPLTRTLGFIFKDSEMEELWHDIETIIKPSWATSVPSNISSAGAKLKSDQWRSIGSVFLPLTLIRLWSNAGDESADSEDRKQLLHLTMLLCSAISVITSRAVSMDQAGYYLGYLTEYRKELKRLFPQYVSHPNHHMAMHLGEFLMKFGPVHGWWTFPFERMIGKLQRIHTNYKPGEYEQTISQSWTQSSNLHALFSKNSCPAAIKNCAGMFEALTRPDNRNVLAGSNADEEYIPEFDHRATGFQHPLPQPFITAFEKVHGGIPRYATRRSHITVNGVSYCRNDYHEGNSGVFKKGSQVPFAIIDIIEFPDTPGLDKLWVILRSYQDAPVRWDPYSSYPHIRAKLWDSRMSTDIEAVRLSDIDTHYAKCKVAWEGNNCIAVISLSKTHVVW